MGGAAVGKVSVFLPDDVEEALGDALRAGAHGGNRSAAVAAAVRIWTATWWREQLAAQAGRLDAAEETAFAERRTAPARPVWPAPPTGQ